ncbi:helix-turn-helix transcriptional regulator [Actinocrinis puniceicyclus]|uniref:Helix-turn-helix transcriptional regulator n=1 Tax=Actinocrinis puniceicyclus TaxID=977794 RepID=A0A8J7WQM1_9ACTN|nr:PadR family transcriptional regulator [Actinocrinis puniceicyclus]MBS2964304.1 helix-turn-helix transcriptional regulator [Actinocrinis puniceicyclus]
MTPVFGHGRLRLYLLKLLEESPRHGYEIIQQLRERFAGLYAPSAGTVYPRLARLESEGLVRHETDGGRKVYQITEAGRRELAARAEELEALESEIRDSVNDLAEGIRDEVRESARTVREELEAEAREAALQAAREASEGPARAGTGAGSAAGAGPRPGAWGPGAPFDWRSMPGGPPPESADWDRDQWRDWKREQREQWRDWKRDLGGQREQWKDWQRAWKEQWARQWKEQWEEQWARQRQGQPPGPPWAWLFGGAPFWGHEEGGTRERADQPPAGEPQDAVPGQPGGGKSGGRRPFDWEVFGPQLRDLFEGVRRDAGPFFDSLRRHGPLSETQKAEAKAIIDRAVADLRNLFEGPHDRGPGDAA